LIVGETCTVGPPPELDAVLKLAGEPLIKFVLSLFASSRRWLLRCLARLPRSALFL
jgi:hypothetical protein